MLETHRRCCVRPSSECAPDTAFMWDAQIDKCFGFDTAVEQAQEALLAAKVEASSAYRGIGVVKLMGRSSGFIAMQASLASGPLTPWLTPLPTRV